MSKEKKISLSSRNKEFMLPIMREFVTEVLGGIDNGNKDESPQTNEKIRSDKRVIKYARTIAKTDSMMERKVSGLNIYQLMLDEGLGDSEKVDSEMKEFLEKFK
jgi:hypothetical protein